MKNGGWVAECRLLLRKERRPEPVSTETKSIKRAAVTSRKTLRPSAASAWCLWDLLFDPYQANNENH